jgi:serine/threonine protein phosphatase PrpC
MNTTRIAYAADQGPRDNYEDACAAFRQVIDIVWQLTYSALLVCDGVGGSAAGEVASRMGVQQIVSSLVGLLLASIHNPKAVALCPDAFLDALCHALRQANTAISEQALARPEFRGMATTVVCAMTAADQLFVAWAGDSRCYLYRGGNLQALTTDHSEVQDRIRAGLLDPKDAWAHPLAHRINRYLGQAENFAPETRLCRLAEGDIVLLCTDGLTDVLTDETITALIREYECGTFHFEELPQILVQEALVAGTTDNVTVLCYEHQASPAPGLHPLTRTLTGSYSTAVGKTLNHFYKESSHA